MALDLCNIEEFDTCSSINEEFFIKVNDVIKRINSIGLPDDNQLQTDELRSILEQVSPISVEKVGSFDFDLSGCPDACYAGFCVTNLARATALTNNGVNYSNVSLFFFSEARLTSFGSPVSQAVITQVDMQIGDALSEADYNFNTDFFLVPIPISKMINIPYILSHSVTYFDTNTDLEIPTPVGSHINASATTGITVKLCMVV